MADTDGLDREQLIGAWIALHSADENSSDYERNFWAHEKLWDLNKDDPELCCELTLEILRRTDKARILHNLAAGPLEDLLSAHGSRFIERIENEATRNDRFRRLLGGVWQNAMPDEIWERVRTAAGHVR